MTLVPSSDNKAISKKNQITSCRNSYYEIPLIGLCSAENYNEKKYLRYFEIVPNY